MDSSGTVTVTDVLPTGLTAITIGGTGWAWTLANSTTDVAQVLAAAEIPTLSQVALALAGLSAAARRRL